MDGWPQTRAVVSRDLKIAFRSGGGWFYALLFFAIFASLAGLAFGPDIGALRRAAPAVVWLAAAFAVQFTVAEIFSGDMNDGFFHAFAAEEESLFPYFLAKFLFVLLTAAAPMTGAAPVIFAMYGVSAAPALGATALLLTGLPAIILVSIFAAALAAGLRAGGMLAIMIAAPIIAPVLIFGVLATKQALSAGDIGSPETMVLAALTLLFAALMPPATILVFRAALE